MAISDVTFGRSILIMIGIGFLALIGLAAATLWLNERNQAYADLVLLAREVEDSTRTLLSHAQDAETGQRGFLLTKDPEFLVPYEQAVGNIPGEMARLRQLTVANTAIRPLIDKFSDSIADRMGILRENLDIARENAGNVSLERMRRGKVAMDALRAVTDKIVAEEERLFVERSAETKFAGRALLATDLVGLILIGALAVGCYFVARGYLREMIAARQGLQAMNADLNEIVEERTGEVMRANEEIQRFAYIVSHDLRSPLVNIMGFTSELEAAGKTLARQQEIIAESAPDLVIPEAADVASSEMPEAIGFIRASTAKMDRLINAILKLSRDGRSSLTAERVDVEKMAQQIADSLKHQTEELEAQIEIEGAPSIVTDRLSIEQVFGNLIENSVKYLDPKRPGRIIVRGRENGAYAEFEIEDNGRGIDTKDHERVFELFRRSGRQDIAGEGLGLAFVRSSVRKLGGSIRLDSELGKGTTMHLKFPKILMARQGVRR